jgi:hypothetical protein
MVLDELVELQGICERFLFEQFDPRAPNIYRERRR